jgi:Uma2 family endonuclease
MATTEAATISESEFRPYRMTIDRYERLAMSGVYPKKEPIFLWKGRLVQKIEGDVVPTPEGDFPEHRMTVDRFIGLVDAGVFTKQDRVFLWHGSLVEKMSTGRPHIIAQLAVLSLLNALALHGYHTELEAPLEVKEDTLPEPDLAVIRGTSRDYPIRPPTARDVALIIEVSESSLAIDSGRKLADYASEGIPVYWIVNLPNRWIDVYSGPVGSTYRDHQVYGPDDEVPVVLDGREVGRILVREILP